MTSSMYPEIKPQIKSELEELTNDGQSLIFQIGDFWRWSMSDLLSNATRGIFAEFIVLTAIGFDKAIVRDEWADYDLLSSDGKIKIEVKSAAYIQSWEQSKLSNIIFNIKAPKSTNIRPANVYVFCLLKHKEQETIDPLKMEQWEFYVVKTETLNEYERSKSSITLNSIRKLSDAIPYNQLKNRIIL